MYNKLQRTIQRFSLEKKSLFLSLLLALMAILAPTNTEASHLRYAKMSWTRANTGSRTVTFKITTAWRTSYFSGVSVGATINPNSGSLDFGDAANQNDLTFVVTSINASEDWFTAERTITHTYAGSATSFNASYTNCCKINSLQNNSDLNLRSNFFKSFSNSIDAFTSEDLAFYFGFSSEFHRSAPGWSSRQDGSRCSRQVMPASVPPARRVLTPARPRADLRA